jgi:hypothetical protein
MVINVVTEAENRSHIAMQLRKAKVLIAEQVSEVTHVSRDRM